MRYHERWMSCCADADSVEDIESVLSTLTDGTKMVELLMAFFATYLYEQFCRVFFKQLVQKHGEQRAESFLSDVFDYIKSQFHNLVVGRDASELDWFGKVGEQMTNQILQDTLLVFES